MVWDLIPNGSLYTQVEWWVGPTEAKKENRFARGHIDLGPGSALPTQEAPPHTTHHGWL